MRIGAGVYANGYDTVVYCISLAVNRRYRFSNKQIAVNGVKIINLIARMTVSVSHLHSGVIVENVQTCLDRTLIFNDYSVNNTDDVTAGSLVARILFPYLCDYVEPVILKRVHDSIRGVK